MNKGIDGMGYSSEARHRRSIRLKGYDYAQAGAYFVTVCSRGRECVFGEVVEGEVRLNGVGRVVEEVWGETARMRPEVELDAFVVMPNHFHASMFVRAADKGRMQYAPTFRSPAQTVGAVVRGFKSATTRRINEMRSTTGVQVWQRNYYEHVIRNEEELRGVRQYIEDNPAKWALDEENPAVG